MKYIKTTWNFLKNYLKYYKLQILWIIFCAIYTGVGAVCATFALQFAMQAIRDDALVRMTIICVIILAFYASSWFIHYSLYWLNSRVSQKISFKIRNDLFKKINELPMKFFDTNTPGEIMSNFTNDVNNISVFLSDNLADLLGVFVWIFGLGIAIYVISWPLALISTFLSALILFVTIKKIRKSLPYFKNFQIELGKFTSFIEETIAGQGVIDLFEQQKIINDKFELMQQKLINNWSNATFYSLQSYPYIDGLTNISIALITGISILFINFKVNFITIPGLAGAGDVDGMVAAMSIFILMVRNFLSPLFQLPTIINIFLGMSVGIERINAIFSHHNEFNNIEKISIALALDLSKSRTKKFNDSKNKNHLILKPTVQFKNVKFEYEKNIPILKNISFDIKEKEMIGIVGPTGSGKTTIINLLTKLYEINAGDILIGGKSIKNIDRNSLRKNISLVLQDTFLFKKTILENLKLGNPDASFDEVVEACKKACCHNLIMSLPNGYETIMSNDNNQLSKGQKQLISIARSIISNSKIIIFDEATSSVDVKTEQLIHKAMNNLFSERTVIMIAHSLATIRNADKILVVKDGELLESGNHSELLKLNGFYARLHNSQINELD